MGCLGCELFPLPIEILEKIDKELSDLDSSWRRGRAGEVFRKLIAEIPHDDGEFSRALTTSNIYHLRGIFADLVNDLHGASLGREARKTIESAVVCYAGTLHLNKARSIVNPSRKVNVGYAPYFEKVTRFPGRVAMMARSKKPLKPDAPWLDGQPHLVFVSDMGDAFSRPMDLEYLREDAIPAITSPEGLTKMWLWLTKRPTRMAEFAESLGGLPQNICAMTTLTSRESLHRVDELRAVKASCRGLSIEPQWERLPAGELDLSGIDWVIVGGESGAYDRVSPYHLEWVDELMEHCRDRGVAFFVKQLGRRPLLRGVELKLKDSHGGDWSEWPAGYGVREFPAAFRDLTANADCTELQLLN